MADARHGPRLVAAALAAALMPLNSTMIAVAIPAISTELAREPVLVTQSLVTSYLIAAVVLQGPAGKIGDRIGHARMVMAGQLLVGVGALLGLVASALSVLILARILMAAGGAALIPSTLALLRHRLPPERRGRAFGAFGAVMAVSAALGPLIGGELVKAFGWTSVFTVNLPVLAASLAVAAFAGRADTPDRAPAPRFDWIGTALLAGGLTATILGLRPDGHHVILLLVVGVALLVPFGVWERRVSDPVVSFSLFRSVHFSAGTVLVALQNLVVYALMFQIPIVAAALFGIDARETGRLLVSMMLATVITSPIAGRLTDRLGARPVAVAGSVMALLGVADLARIDMTTPSQLVLPTVLLGVGLGLATPAAQSAAMTAIGSDLAGMAAGVASTMRYLGGIAGVSIMSLLLDVHGTRSDVISDNRSVLAVFAGMLVAGLACSVLLPGRGGSSSGPSPFGRGPATSARQNSRRSSPKTHESNTRNSHGPDHLALGRWVTGYQRLLAVFRRCRARRVYCTAYR